MDRDPVCGAVLRPGQEGASITYQDRTFHFCSVECKREFEKNAKTYVARSEAAPR